jgi:thioesterase domain-containing protein
MHGPREAAGSIEEIAAAVVEAVRSVQPNGPYFLFGYSLGAFVMYEAAAMLAENGERIGLVVLADALHPRFTAAQWRRARARRRSVRRRARKLFSRRGPEAITRRVRRLLRLSPPPRRVRLLPGADVVADWAAVIDRERKYVPRSARGPVAILATRSYIAAARSPDLGWADLLTAGWSAQEVPGSHESMIGEPHVHVLIARLGELLDAARAPISS